MLSTQYRQRLEFICAKIAKGEEVKLEDMIWATKLAKQTVPPVRCFVLLGALRRTQTCLKGVWMIL